MKTTKVQGFTLIELIVVMATFSIIMFGAMSLMTPASKVMIQSETYENGNAAVTSVTSYLEKSLSSAENLRIYNYEPADIDAAVWSFADEFYGGLLRDNTPDADNPRYADGTIHVMVLDNSGITFDAEGKPEGNSIIKEYTYQVDDFGSISPYVTDSKDTAINKAYYDSYDLQIRVGAFDDENDVEYLSAPDDPTFRQSLRADQTSFTVRAKTHPMANGQTYSFLKNTVFALSGGKGLSDFAYYCGINDAGDEIVQIASSTPPSGSARPTSNPEFKDPAPTYEAFTTCCFIYAYGAEINTRG